MGVKSNVQGISIAPLKTALQYADSELGIDVETSSYSDICDALAEYFPDFDGKWLYGGVYNDNFGAVTTSGSTTYSKSTNFTTSTGATTGTTTVTILLNNAKRFNTIKATASISRQGSTTSGSITLLDSSGTTVSSSGLTVTATTISFNVSSLTDTQKEFLYLRITVNNTGQYTVTTTTTQIIGE